MVINCRPKWLAETKDPNVDDLFLIVCVMARHKLVSWILTAPGVLRRSAVTIALRDVVESSEPADYNGGSKEELMSRTRPSTR